MTQNVAFALLMALASAAGSTSADLRTICGGVPQYHTELVSSSSHSYSIHMGGSIDGEMTRDPVGYWAYDQYWEPNISVRIENVGDVPVVNPWLLREGKPDTRTVRSIVSHLISDDIEDSEKARRLWEFEIKNRFHATTDDEEVDDVIKRFNAYGYTLCGNESKIMSDLWRAAGLRVRRGFPNGHSTAEVFYDGGWHLLDSDESIICLLRDNKTIASEAQIVSDHDLMKRTHTYGPLHNDARMRDETSAALHYYEGERSGEQPSLTRHKMDFALRPGEAITWAWQPSSRFHGRDYQDGQGRIWNRRWRLIAHVMNGELTYAPDLRGPDSLEYWQADGVEHRSTAPYGAGVYLTGRSGTVTIPVKTAYPIVGGRLEVDFARREIREEHIKVSLSFDHGETWQEVWTSFSSDYARMYIDLNEFFPAEDPARYEYLLRFDLISEVDDPLVCLKGLYLTSILQMARLAMPGLSLGDNSFTYTDQSRQGRQVKITHSWCECAAAEVPGPPPAALYPPNGGAADGTGVTFQWQPLADGVPAADYEFQLSEYADMRWVLSPNFHKLISRTYNPGSSSYELPYTGLLNPDQTYYWRVRARSPVGVWGPWSEVFDFRATAPAVPVNLSAHFDQSSRSVTLRWEPGDGGTKPTRYRVYGSDERGFTIHDAPYEYHAGLAGIRESPANLLLETDSPARSVNLRRGLWRPYYRVVAIDSEGRQSGPSAMGELRHPLIVTSELPSGKVATFYEARIETSASIGHLVSADENGKPYQMRYRAGDQLVYDLSGAPEGLSIHRESGTIGGYLPAHAAGNYELSVTVTDDRSGRQDAVKLALAVTKD